jgi:hypothetical protein
MREETRGAYVRLMSANLAATGLEGYGPHAELYLYQSHRIPAATWDAIQTCVSKGATITRIGEQ